MTTAFFTPQAPDPVGRRHPSVRTTIYITAHAFTFRRETSGRLQSPFSRWGFRDSAPCFMNLRKVIPGGGKPETGSKPGPSHTTPRKWSTVTFRMREHPRTPPIGAKPL
jgi:hypothetical protein